MIERQNPEEVTIKDIARKAKVSYATVSRALNNKRGVREATRRKILELAVEMAYAPNAIARCLVKKQIHTLGLIVPDITNPFFPEVARGIEEGASEAQFSLFLLGQLDGLIKNQRQDKDKQRPSHRDLPMNNDRRIQQLT